MPGEQCDELLTRITGGACHPDTYWRRISIQDTDYIYSVIYLASRLISACKYVAIGVFIRMYNLATVG